MEKFTHLNDGIHLVDAHIYGTGCACCYLIIDSGEAAVVDCGTAFTLPHILKALSSLGLTKANLRYVIPTHVHLDHAGGAGQLMQACPEATLICHPRGATHMIDPSRLQAGATAVYGEAAFKRDFDELLPIPEQRVIAAEDGQTFPLGQRELTFVYSPGHANHHGCIFDSQARGFFTGDTFGLSYPQLANADGKRFLFATTTPVAFDPDSWFDTLDRLMSFEPQAMYLTHFGRVDNPAEQVGRLRQSIQHHVDAALTEETSGSEDGRHARLKQRLTEQLWSDLREHGNELEPEQQARIMENDLELNAQGLVVWLKRRAKARAES